MLRIGWTKLYFYFCILVCGLEVCIPVFVYNRWFLCVVEYVFEFAENADVGRNIG